jgi:hypothetical protein
MFLEECTYCGRPATFKKLTVGSHRQQPPLRPHERTPCCATCNFIKLSGRLHSASLSTHPHLHAGVIAREDYRQEWGRHRLRTTRQGHVDSQRDKRLATSKAQFKADHQPVPLLWLSSGGSIVTTPAPDRVRHRQHGSMLQRAQLHEG